jgi:hypothetical protein
MATIGLSRMVQSVATSYKTRLLAGGSVQAHAAHAGCRGVTFSVILGPTPTATTTRRPYRPALRLWPESGSSVEADLNAPIVVRPTE